MDGMSGSMKHASVVLLNGIMSSLWIFIPRQSQFATAVMLIWLPAFLLLLRWSFLFRQAHPERMVGIEARSKAKTGITPLHGRARIIGLQVLTAFFVFGWWFEVLNIFVQNNAAWVVHFASPNRFIGIGGLILIAISYPTAVMLMQMFVIPRNYIEPVSLSTSSRG